MKKYLKLFCLIFILGIFGCSVHQKPIALQDLEKNQFTVLKENESVPTLRVYVQYTNTKKLVDVEKEMIKGFVDFYHVGTYEIEIHFASLQKIYSIIILNEATTISEAKQNLNQNVEIYAYLIGKDKDGYLYIGDETGYLCLNHCSYPFIKNQKVKIRGKVILNLENDCFYRLNVDEIERYDGYLNPVLQVYHVSEEEFLSDDYNVSYFGNMISIHGIINSSGYLQNREGRTLLKVISSSAQGVFVKITGILFSYRKDEQLFVLKCIGLDKEIEEMEDRELKTIEIDSFVSTDAMTRYNTGNYGSLYRLEYMFEYYRAYHNIYNDFTTLLPFLSQSMNGAFYNVTPIPQIDKIEITYRCQSDAIIYTGKKKNKVKTTILSANLEYNTETIYTDEANYFSVETKENELCIKTIIIYYADIYSVTEASLESYNCHRINPNCYAEEKIAGVSYIDVPIKGYVENDTYIVEETKRYTYYTYEYISLHPEFAIDAAYIDPIDVASYFIAFSTYPANYVSKSDYREAYSIFKENTRCVSEYTRTDGYARKVPCVKINGEPLYYECDIALTADYANTNRGVGRLIVWLYGFSGNGYDDAPVAVYTDDHYQTFQEYLNTGEFSARFNAESNRTIHIWNNPITLKNPFNIEWIFAF